MKTLSVKPPTRCTRRDWGSILNGKLTMLTVPTDAPDRDSLKNLRPAIYANAKRLNMQVSTAIVTDKDALDGEEIGLLIGPMELMHGNAERPASGRKKSVPATSAKKKTPAASTKKKAAPKKAPKVSVESAA